jgi:uncharacterized protein (UPF0332 family)
MKDEISALVDKAKRSIEASKRMIDDGDYDFAVSRAYYALFYVSEALLLKKGKSFSKHAAVISGLYEEYVKTGELPKEFHKTLHRAFDLRQQGDYLSSVQVTKEVAEELVADVRKQMDLAITRDYF